MASCLKCGKSKLRSDKFGRRKCRRCGVMPSNKHLDRGGNYPLIDDDEDEQEETPMHPSHDFEISVAAMTTDLQELPDHRLEELQRAVSDEQFRRRFFSTQSSESALARVGLGSAGEALGGLGLLAALLSGTFLGCIADAIVSDAQAATSVTTGRLPTFESGPLDWLALTALIIFAGYIVWRAIASARERCAIYRQYADATNDGLNELYDDAATEEASEFDEAEIERSHWHWVVTAGMFCAALDRDSLAELLPDSFPYPEF